MLFLNCGILLEIVAITKPLCTRPDKDNEKCMLTKHAVTIK